MRKLDAIVDGGRRILFRFELVLAGICFQGNKLAKAASSLLSPLINLY